MPSVLESFETWGCPLAELLARRLLVVSGANGGDQRREDLLPALSDGVSPARRRSGLVACGLYGVDEGRQAAMHFMRGRSVGEGKHAFWCTECWVVVCIDHLAQHCLSGDGKHPVQIFQGQSATTSSEASLQRCSKHGKPLQYFCVTCDECICYECSVVAGERHNKHYPIKRIEDVVSERKTLVCKEAEKLIDDTQRLERGITAVDEVSSRLSTRADEVRTEIRSAGQEAVKAIDDQVCHLLQEVQDVEDSRSKHLDHQREDLRRQLQKVRSALRFKEKLIARCGERQEAMPSLLALQKRLADLCKADMVDRPQQHARLAFSASDGQTLKNAVGEVSLCNASAGQCTVEGDLIKPTDVGSPVTFMVQARDKKGKALTAGGDNVRAYVVGGADCDRSPCEITVEDKEDGSYAVTAVLVEKEEVEIEISVNGEMIPRSWKVTIKMAWFFDPDVCHPDIRLDNGNSQATNHSGSSLCSVIGKIGMRRGKHTWRVQLGDDVDIGIGVTTKPFHQSTDDFQQAYYWQCNTYRYLPNPHRWFEHNAFQGFQPNDTLRFDLNCEAHTLTITTQGGKKDTITDLPDREIFPYFCLRNQGQSVTLVN